MLRAAVLAGGKSSRMGSDKALLPWQGVTLLDHAIGLLQQSGASQVFVSGRPDHPLGVPDLWPHAGPPGAVLSLLEWLEARGELDGAPLLLIPVDMPLLTPNLLRWLVSSAQQVGSGYCERAIFPCIVPASPQLRQHLQGLFAESHEPGGQRSMRAIFGFLGSRALAVEAAQLAQLANVNTPAEWQALGNNNN